MTQITGVHKGAGAKIKTRHGGAGCAQESSAVKGFKNIEIVFNAVRVIVFNIVCVGQQPARYLLPLLRAPNDTSLAKAWHNRKHDDFPFFAAISPRMGLEYNPIDTFFRVQTPTRIFSFASSASFRRWHQPLANLMVPTVTMVTAVSRRRRTGQPPHSGAVFIRPAPRSARGEGVRGGIRPRRRWAAIGAFRGFSPDSDRKRKRRVPASSDEDSRKVT